MRGKYALPSLDMTQIKKQYQEDYANTTDNETPSTVVSVLRDFRTEHAERPHLQTRFLFNAYKAERQTLPTGHPVLKQLLTQTLERAAGLSPRHNMKGVQEGEVTDLCGFAEFAQLSAKEFLQLRQTGQEKLESLFPEDLEESAASKAARWTTLSPENQETYNVWLERCSKLDAYLSFYFEANYNWKQQDCPESLLGHTGLTHFLSEALKTNDEESLAAFMPYVMAALERGEWQNPTLRALIQTPMLRAIFKESRGASPSMINAFGQLLEAALPDALYRLELLQEQASLTFIRQSAGDASRIKAFGVFLENLFPETQDRQSFWQSKAGSIFAVKAAAHPLAIEAFGSVIARLFAKAKDQEMFWQSKTAKFFVAKIGKEASTIAALDALLKKTFPNAKERQALLQTDLLEALTLQTLCEASATQAFGGFMGEHFPETKIRQTLLQRIAKGNASRKNCEETSQLGLFNAKRIEAFAILLEMAYPEPRDRQAFWQSDSGKFFVRHAAKNVSCIKAFGALLQQTFPGAEIQQAFWNSVSGRTFLKEAYRHSVTTTAIEALFEELAPSAKTLPEKQT